MQISGNKIIYSNKKFSNKFKKNKKIKKFVIILLFTILIIAVITVTVFNRVSPRIVEYCKSRTKSISTLAINKAIFLSLSSVSYTDFINIERNTDGDITLLQANSFLINDLARITTTNTEIYLNNSLHNGIDIPSGTLTAIPLLSGKGPIINISVSPHASVTCIFISQFESAGINQTRHMIMLEVHSTIELIIPTSNSTFTLVNQILVCESIIVGKIPSVFLQSGTLNK